MQTEVSGKTQPEIVLHLAAQPIVRDILQGAALYTYETNVMGTVNISVNASDENPCVKAFPECHDR